MLLSVRHLFSLAWANLVAALGTTTLSILVFSFAIPVLSFVITLAVDWRQQRRTGVTVNTIIRGSLLSWQTLVPSTVYLVAWVCLLSWSLSSTVYRDHRALLGRIRTLISQNKTLQSANEALNNENEQLKSTPVKTLTRTLPPPEPEKKCWMSHHFGLPNSTVEGAVTTTAVILRCNYKITSPYQVAVEFDRDFIPGALTLPDAGGWMGGNESKINRTMVAQISNPALLSEQLVIVTVYGSTDQYPRALHAGIKALD